MKKTFYFFLIFTLIIFLGTTNIFLRINSDNTHIIGINIIFALYFLITFICELAINKTFKKSDLTHSKNYRKDMRNTFANAFFASSIISIISACIIYGFLRELLELLNLKTGYINYCIFASKIWFISSPFIGLEITIFKYFYEIEYFKKPIKILFCKLVIFFIISLLFFQNRKANCFIYAKPLCDIIFLPYYSKICFDITLNKT